jgi:hypothetical protein
MGALMATDYDWSAEVRQLKMPVMLAFADHDAVSTKHIAEHEEVKDVNDWKATPSTPFKSTAPALFLDFGYAAGCAESLRLSEDWKVNSGAMPQI